MLQTRFVDTAFSAGLMMLAAGMALGQDYPTKPIRILAGGAGGSSDFSARLIAQGISGPLGQPVIVENRPSNVLAEMTAKAPPDGYTLHLTGSVAWISPMLRKVSYDAVRDFAPITLAAISPFLLIVHPSLPAKSVKELIALAKARPGQLNRGSSGIGGSNNLATDLFESMTGVKMADISYRGSLEALTGLITGEIQVLFANDDSLNTHAKAGRIRVLAVTSAQPTALHPGVPTVAAVVPGYEAVSIVGLWAPAGTPAAVINRLYQETARVLNRPDVKEKFLSIGSDVVASTPAEFTAVIKSEIAKWAKLLKDTGVKPQE